MRIDDSVTLEEALSRLLADAPCRWRIAAPGAVEIGSAPAAPEAIRPPPPPVTVGELLVTATRRVRDPRQLAVAVTAIPRKQLEATAAADAGDASGQFAGVLATNLGPGRNKLLLRGLSDGAYTGRARSTVATYLDGIPLNYNAPDPDLRLVDVERVEVARGPQGALYGAGSLSGVYRIVTRRPAMDGFAAGLHASGALTDDGAASTSVEGYLNQPLWGQVGVRLSAYQEVQGGYVDDALQGRSNVDRTERRGARVSLLFEPNDAWSFSVTAAGQHLRSDDTHYTTPGTGLNRSVRIPEPHVNDIELASATVRRSWGWGELTSSTGYIRHAYGSLYDATAVQDRYTSFATTSAYSERNRTRMVVQDLVLTSRGSGPLEWLVGGYASDTKVQSPTQLLAQNPRLPNVIVYADDRRDHIRELAAYGEASYAFAPRWSAAVGARVFSIRNHSESAVVSERFMPRFLNFTGDFTGVSPKISLQYQPGKGQLIYVVASEGYRSGGVNSGGALPLPIARQAFRPDRLQNIELGVKLNGLDDRVSVNSALFYDVWRDIQTDQFRPSGIPYTTNAGDAHILGLELEVAYRPTDSLTVQLNGRLSRTRTTKPNPEFRAELADGLPGAPAVSGGGLISYQRPAFGDYVFRVTGQASYVGHSRVTFDAASARMGGYARTKVVAEISDARQGLQLFIINPLNDFSDTFAFGNPFNPNGVRQITPQRPRTVGLTLFATL